MSTQGGEEQVRVILGTTQLDNTAVHTCNVDGPAFPAREIDRHTCRERGRACMYVYVGVSIYLSIYVAL